MKRFFRVRRDDWYFDEPRRHYYLPFFDVDDYGRKTLVQYLPWGIGFCGVVLRTCFCAECVDCRKATLMAEQGGSDHGARV